MLNGRIYRAAFVPLLFALVIAGFSLGDRVAPLGSNLAPDAFSGARALATLQRLAARFPDRRPGSAGDEGLAAEVARTLRALGGATRGGFALSTRRFRAQTIDGARTLTTVIAQRPGTTGEAPIVILAHRDAAGAGGSSSEAELSGTAALLELARVLAAGETQRTIVLVSTSGGSGGNAGAADFAEQAGTLIGAGAGGGGAGEGGAGGPIDAALVLGDLAGERLRAPFVASLADGPSTAPALLQSTLAAALAQQTGLPVGGSGGAGGPGGAGEAGGASPDIWSQLAHLVFPLPAGEQGPLDARGLPAVLLGVGGERPPPADEPVSAARLEGFGRAALSAVYALDAAGEVPRVESGLPIQHKAIPGWALRLLVAALLLPALAALGDGLARLRRRGEPLGRSLLWTLACGLPFLAGALFAILLGRLGAIPAPRPPVTPAALPFDSTALKAVLAVALVLVLAWLARPALMRRLGLAIRPRTDAAVLAPLLLLGALAAVVWVFDPLTALLLAPALHLWLLFASPLWAGESGLPPGGGVASASRPPGGSGLSRARGSGRSRSGGPGLIWTLGLLALGLVPLALLVAFYAAQLELGLGGVAHTAVLLLAGGRIGIAGAVLWSAAFGVPAALLLVALAPAPMEGPRIGGPQDGLGKYEAITVRGPLSYAGPGSLGGTESALRR